MVIIKVINEDGIKAPITIELIFLLSSLVAATERSTDVFIPAQHNIEATIYVETTWLKEPNVDVS